MAINLSEARPVNNKILNEKDTRNNHLAFARMLGCEQEYKQVLNKYDGLLRSCTNDKEREDIAKLGIVEVNRLFSFYKQMYINGNIVNIK